MDPFIFIYSIVLIALMGLVVGSFIAASAYRIPRKIVISRGRSKCPSCEHTLKWYDLIPLVSFLLVGGRCRYCKGKISKLYPTVEFLNAAFWVLMFLEYGLTLNTLLYIIVVSSLILLSAIDISHMIIPDRTLVIILAAGILKAIFSEAGDIGISDRIIGFFVVSIPFFLIALIKPEGMGGGDIKLMAVAGFLLGWTGILIALVIGSCSGAVYGVAGIVSRTKKRDDQVPFGPFLASGILISLLYGPKILNWYLGIA
jgi:leader peptidase (prepilin peptidase)/N-methyltransferase